MIDAGRGGVGDTGEPAPADIRNAMIRLARAVDVKDVPVGSVQDVALPRPGGGGGGRPLPIRVYTPVAAIDRVSAAVVYFHGGAGVFCNVDTHDGLCRMLATGSGCRVISVDYRLAPEHQFPAGLDDCTHATQWVLENAAFLGIDPARVAVGGDSAGGTFAAVICQGAREADGPRFALQVLFCPVTDLSADSESRTKFATGYFIERSTLEWAKRQYCPPGIDLTDARLSPLHARSFAGLPPAHIHTAEFDPMLDEGKAYADALSAAGGEVRYVCHAGMIHHFYAMAGAIPYARAAIASAAAAINTALGGVT